LVPVVARAERHIGSRPDLSGLYVYWHEERKVLQVTGLFGYRAIPPLNSDKDARQRVANALKKIYRYDGPFEFEEDDFPF